MDSELTRGSNLLKETLLNAESFTSGILPFDELFANNLMLGGDIIEIIGPPASGKTMITYTIMINVLEARYDISIFLIDTKFDFQPIKFKNIMDHRGISEAEQVSIMKRIVVEQARTPEDLINSLKFICNTPLQHRTLKMIIVDSITVPFYLYIGHTLMSLSLMTELISLMRILAKRNLSIIVTNLANHRDDQNLNTTSQDSMKSSERELKARVKPALGMLWESVAQHKVLIDFIYHPHQFESDLEKIHRHISLFASKTSAAPTEPKLVEITDKGVI